MIKFIKNSILARWEGRLAYYTRREQDVYGGFEKAKMKKSIARAKRKVAYWKGEGHES